MKNAKKLMYFNIVIFFKNCYLYIYFHEIITWIKISLNMHDFFSLTWDESNWSSFPIFRRLILCCNVIDNNIYLYIGLMREEIKYHGTRNITKIKVNLLIYYRTAAITISKVKFGDRILITLLKIILILKR